MVRFRDRFDAGRRLAEALEAYAGEDPLVLALPRGGVPVGYEVARALGAPLDVWVVRKMGVPWHPELGVGAVAEGGALFIAEDLARKLGLSDEVLAELAEAKRREVEARVKTFRGPRPPPSLRGRTVILVDDGVATGGTVRAALQSIRARGPKKLVLAVPVAAPEVAQELAQEADQVVALMRPRDFEAVGRWYEDFTQVEDDEVVRLLDRAHQARRAQGPKALRREVSLAIPAGGVTLEGDFAVPAGAQGVVVCGSSRASSRNRFVAERLRAGGLGTLLFELLTAEEEEADAVEARLRFDVSLLARRLGQVTDWLTESGHVNGLPLGYFGASTGAAAALGAEAERPGRVRAIVSRGGRPDLVGQALRRVRAPTLLIVGGDDTEVLRLNEAAFVELGGVKELSVVPHATHLFEEPGALDVVAQLAQAWFLRHLAGRR